MRRLFIIRKNLHMSTGKLLAQVGHCAEAYWMNILKNGYLLHTNFTGDRTVSYVEVRIPLDIMIDYVEDLFTKTVCGAKNKNHLLKAKVMADEMGLIEGKDYGLIYDKCLTELTPEEENGTTLTGVWFCPLPDEYAHAISKKYHLYV